MILLHFSLWEAEILCTDLVVLATTMPICMHLQEMHNSSGLQEIMWLFRTVSFSQIIHESTLLQLLYLRHFSYAYLYS